MRRSLLALCAAVACTRPPAPSLAVNVDSPPATEYPSAPRPPAVRSCPARTAPSTAELKNAKIAGDVDGITYATALHKEGEEYVPVLLWLSSDGTLAFLPIAREAIQRSVQGRTLHLLGMPKDWKELFIESIDVGRPDAPSRRVDQKIGGMTGGSLGSFASDDKRALIDGVFYRNGKHEPVAYEVDRANGNARERKDIALQDSTYCDGTACVLVALDRGARRSVALWEPHDGSARESLEIGPFPGNVVYRVPLSAGALLVARQDDGWSATRVSSTTPHLSALPPVKGPSGSCRGVPVLSGSWAGVISCKESLRSFVRWDLTKGPSAVVESFPESLFASESFASHGSSVVRLAWEGGAGLRHGPEYHGIREYHEHWTFAGGRVSLIDLREGAWVEGEATPLALANARGEFSHGYTPILLQRGSRVAVLLTTDGWRDPAHLQPIREPCQ